MYLPISDVGETAPAALAEAIRPWSPAKRVGFRFGFAYLLLYCLPGSGTSSIFAGLPWIEDWLESVAAKPWIALWHWVAVHIFHLSGAVTMPHPTGSGDTTLSYIQTFCNLVIAVVAALVWTALDRRRTQYQTLYAWLRLVVRFSLAFTLLGYGFAKVFPLQFRPPGLYALTETYGESSPMGLLWNFMGASKAYTIFSGSTEVLAGLLLLFRWTTLLGALVAMGVTLNIVLLNFCYDVPVKLFSTHLLAMAIFLTIPYWPALWCFFILHKPAQPHGVWVPPFTRRWLRVAAIVLQVLVIVSVLTSNLWGGYTDYREAYQDQPSSLMGVWTVTQFNADPQGTPIVPWRRLVISQGSATRLVDQTGDTAKVTSAVDMAEHSIQIGGARWGHSAKFSFQQLDPQHMVLTGKLDDRPVTMTLQKQGERTFLLTTRGFHWISEDPFNR